jgi:hypothetical protein
MTEHTKDKLAAALRAVGLNEMADQAATGYYHDFLSPLALPEIVLVNQLNIEALKLPVQQRTPILELRQRVIDGDFDASEEEADEWANSQEGQDTFRSLIDKK